MISYLVLDVDGTLTDGKIYMGLNSESCKAFNIKDGYAIKNILPNIGVTPIILTGRKSDIVINRCKEIGVEKIYQGIVNKAEKIREISKGELNKFAFMGDDLNDLPAMKELKKAGGVVGCPIDAANEVKEIADFISTSNGGYGAVREFIEWIERGNKLLQNICDDVSKNKWKSYPSTESFMEIAKDEYTKERERAHVLDNKASVVLTAIIAVMAFVIPSIPFEKMLSYQGTHTTFFLFVIGIFVFVFGVLLVCIACGRLFKALLPKGYKRINQEDLSDEKYYDYPSDVSAVLMLRSYTDSSKHNEKINDYKGKRITEGIMYGFIGVFIIMGASIFLRILIGE